MKQLIAFFILLGIGIGLFSLDMLFNPLLKDELVIHSSEEIQTQISPAIIESQGLSVFPAEKASLLFSEFQVNQYTPSPLVSLVFDQELPVGAIYELPADSYFEIRHGLSAAKEEATIFDANNLGEYSAYYNDSTRSETVFRIVRAPDRVFAFEYERQYHEAFVNIAQSLIP